MKYESELADNTQFPKTIWVSTPDAQRLSVEKFRCLYSYGLNHITSRHSEF